MGLSFDAVLAEFADDVFGEVLEATVAAAKLAGITVFAFPEVCGCGITGFFDDLAVLLDRRFVDPLHVLQVRVDEAEDRVEGDEAVVLREQVLLGVGEGLRDELLPRSPVLDQLLGGGLGGHALGGGILEHRGLDGVGEAQLGVQVVRFLRVTRAAQLALPRRADDAVNHFRDIGGLDGIVFALGDLETAGAVQLDHEFAGQVGADLLHRVVDEEELLNLVDHLGVLEDHDRQLVLEELIEAEVLDGDFEAVGAVLTVHYVELVAVAEYCFDAVVGLSPRDLLAVAEQDSGRDGRLTAFGEFLLQVGGEFAGTLLVQLTLVAVGVGLLVEDVDLEARDELIDGNLAGVDGAFCALVDFDELEDHG